VAAAAACELIYDKLPRAKHRSLPPAVAVRVGADALAGGLAARSAPANLRDRSGRGPARFCRGEIYLPE
jgi:hypothetical protein